MNLSMCLTLAVAITIVWQVQCFSLSGDSHCRCQIRRYPQRSTSLVHHIPQRSTTSLNLLWFGGNDDKKKKRRKDSSNDTSSGDPNMEPTVPTSGMGTTANTMENFKQSQELGKKTSALLQDLASVSVEGVAAKGKVKVFFDAQQRPTGVEIDEEYLRKVGVEDLNESLLQAMLDARGKSIQTMQDKMQSLYSDIGLPM